MNAITFPTIVAPGIYQMTSEQYHADPADTPSLSAGMINEMLVAPARCFHASSRLNPEFEASADDGKFTLGTVSHLLFLEPELFESRVAECDFDDWGSGKAKAVREMARQEGKVPILTKHMDKVRAARASFMASEFTRHAFQGGKTEQSMFWRHPTYGFWCRARPDFLSDAGTHLNDYKATANADPEQFGRHAFNMGYHRRAAWYLEGAEILLGKRPDKYWFVNQETSAPYLTSVIELDILSIEAGHAENERAAEIFDRCLRTGDWHAYRHPSSPDKDRAFQVGLPSWAFMQIDARNE